jgi:hypothetical protein
MVLSFSSPFVANRSELQKPNTQLFPLEISGYFAVVVFAQRQNVKKFDGRQVGTDSY